MTDNLKGDEVLRSLMQSNSKKSILMNISAEIMPNGACVRPTEKSRENVKLNFIRVFKLFRSSKNIILIDFFQILNGGFNYDYSKYFKYFLHLQNSKFLAEIKIIITQNLTPINRRFLWKGLSYLKKLEKVTIWIGFSLHIDLCERKSKIKNLCLSKGGLKLIDIFMLKRQVKKLEKYIIFLELPLPELYVYERKVVKLYTSFIFSNSLNKCFKMKNELSKVNVTNTLKKIPDFSIDLFKKPNL